MKKLTQAEYLPIEKLKPFEGHPFYVKDDEEMEQLTESIRQQCGYPFPNIIAFKTAMKTKIPDIPKNIWYLSWQRMRDSI